VPHQELLDEVYQLASQGSLEISELMHQLRPRSAAELDSLLNLCVAAVTIPHLPTLASAIKQDEQCTSGSNGQTIQKQRQVHDRSSGYISGAAHFVKSRHGPFFALMSVLSKLGGRKSPAYWDLYRTSPVVRHVLYRRWELTISGVTSGELP
jgi:hypothetical protein